MEFSHSHQPQSQNFPSYKRGMCAFNKTGFIIRVGKFLNVLKRSYHIKKKCHSDIYKVMESHSHLLQLPFNTSPLAVPKGEKF